jgi:hypothetical protein
MKCTIRKTEQGIVAVSNEQIEDVRPYKGRTILEKGCIINILPDYLTDLSECELILASTFGVGMELVFKPNCPDEWVNFDTEYPYTIQYNKLIITL